MRQVVGFRAGVSERQVKLGRLRLTGWQVWSELLLERHEMNWIDIELVRLHFERAYYKQSVEFNVSLLGFNLLIEWWYGKRAKAHDAASREGK